MSANGPDHADNPGDRTIRLQQTAGESPEEAVRKEHEAIGDQPDLGPLLDSDGEAGDDQAAIVIPPPD